MSDYTKGETRASFKHGHKVRGGFSGTYSSWTAMKARCQQPRSDRYKDYGGRGITVDSRWERFESFLADMGERPLNTTLNRKDNEGPYTKENCIWSTAKEQAQNKRKYSNNKTGIVGVHAASRRGSFQYWSAQCRNDAGKIVTLYNGQDFFEACCARKSWDVKSKGLNGGFS